MKRFSWWRNISDRRRSGPTGKFAHVTNVRIRHLNHDSEVFTVVDDMAAG